MDKTDALTLVHKYAEVVRGVFDCQKIILFGSYATGNPREDSDIDIAVVFPNYDSRFVRQVELMKLTRHIDTRIEPHPFQENEFVLSNPFVNEIMKYGMEIETP